MSSLGPILEELGEDVLLQILCSSDIYTTLSASRVNRYLNEITRAKQLWVLHVQDLVRRGLIDIPPPFILEDFSTASLIDLVKCVVTGPETWTAGSVPQVSAEITLNPVKDSTSGFVGDCRAKLLAGGRHLLFPRSTALELWDVTTQRLIWSAPFSPLHFEARPAPGSIILAALPFDETTGATILEIHHIDTRAGESTALLRLPVVQHDCLQDPKIRDDLVLVPMRALLIEAVLLINWHTQRYMLLEVGLFTEAPDVGLLPGHLFVATPYSASHDGLQLDVYNLKTLEPLWRRLADINFAVRVKLVDHAHSVLPLPTAGLLPTDIEILQMVVHESPLNAGIYNISIYAWGYPRRVVARYSCVATIGKPNGQVEVECVSVGRAPDELQDVQQLSYAGYALDGMTHGLWHAASHAESQVLAMAERCEWTHLSTGSGVVTRVMSTEIVLSYYR
ncbi:hypothetical protein B0H17DRAFT_1202111 [Mycena rosella]|uniref:F-box domain-containing protein n=1 Tax=Mycena rosella TaxID=1033263 RepID=A0AAD7GHR6_MYCRO|nr:hypothetical protein B0H17DRAFT_1202111 [Mycena rosella]